LILVSLVLPRLPDHRPRSAFRPAVLARSWTDGRHELSLQLAVMALVAMGLMVSWLSFLMGPFMVVVAAMGTATALVAAVRVAVTGRVRCELGFID
ncbi:MAG: hypothetical protein KDB53_09260, partial [Planctomycetes bacterium]|nr:hypothetical protein [Planctomycetota bacterium]